MKFSLLKRILSAFFLLALAVTPFTAAAVIPIGISNIQVAVTDDSAVVTWETNVPARARIEFGESSEYDLYIEAGYLPTRDHEIRLVNLQPDTVYHYRIIARNSETQAFTFDRTFETLEGGDEETPEILTYRIAYITATTATFQWTTDEKTSSTVRIGRSPNSYTGSVGSGGLVTEHDITLRGLNVSTPYYAQIESRDEDGNVIRSSDIAFRTAPVSDGEKEVLRITNISPTTSNSPQIFARAAIISWDTNKLSDGYVRVGTSENSLGAVYYQDGLRSFNHRVVVDNLKPETTYYFQVGSLDIFNKRVESDPVAFVTPLETSQNSIQQLEDSVQSSREANPSVLFYATFDGSLSADSARGNSVPTELIGSPEQQSGEGRTGGAAFIPAGAEINYSGSGNFTINQGTIMFWVRPRWNPTDNADHVFFSLNSNYVGSGDKYFYIAKLGTALDYRNAVYAGIENARDADFHHVAPDNGLSADQWTHIAFSWDYGGNSALYINGELEATHTISGATPNLGKTIVLGSVPRSADAYLDDLMIFDQPLTGEEIRTELNRNAPTNGAAETVQVLGVSIDAAYTPASALYKTADRPEVYAILKGQKYHIPSEAAFNRYGYHYSDIEIVSTARLASIPNVRLVKSPVDPKIFWLYQREPSRRLKWYLATPSIFESYPVNRYENVVVIAQEDIDGFEQARLIKTKESPTVYLVEGGKRPIVSAEAFERNGFQYENIVEVSDENIDALPTGAPIQ